MRADEDDMQRFYAREARRNPPAWVDIEDRPTAQQIASERLEIAALEESVAEITDEIGRMALARDPDLYKWQAMAEAAEADLAAARERLAELLERSDR